MLSRLGFYSKYVDRMNDFYRIIYEDIIKIRKENKKKRSLSKKVYEKGSNDIHWLAYQDRLFKMMK